MYQISDLFVCLIILLGSIGLLSLAYGDIKKLFTNKDNENND